MDTAVIANESELKLPKNNKCNRYYYRHREEILAKKLQKRLEDPEYLAKQKAKEEAKRAKEEEKVRLKEEKSRERARRKAELLGVLPVVPPGVE
jgi:DNA-directed RNA polymerase beta' subunit